MVSQLEVRVGLWPVSLFSVLGLLPRHLNYFCCVSFVLASQASRLPYNNYQTDR